MASCPPVALGRSSIESGYTWGIGMRRRPRRLRSYTSRHTSHRLHPRGSSSSSRPHLRRPMDRLAMVRGMRATVTIITTMVVEVADRRPSSTIRSWSRLRPRSRPVVVVDLRPPCRILAASMRSPFVATESRIASPHPAPCHLA